ncbi:MAG: hypothetical protein JO128_15895, partial [Alphaproteobacteria bacterium]|nr:hypothetical protein [Alphaproteobacteria bacterium]
MGEILHLTRRAVLAGAGLSLIGGPAWAKAFAHPIIIARPRVPDHYDHEFTYKAWRFNTDAVDGQLGDDIVRSFQAQIDIVDGLTINDGIKIFFHIVPVFVDTSTYGGPGAYRLRRIFLTAQAVPPENPV